ncbi:glycoside hydrolase family 68 protein [Leuconostoc suionicum]|uniref:glycoside hydrolase family 68 protein n=1 Tax=Leuconostoc suionicum TaxID=1511761 RepID=UPI00233EB7CC|nr:glycoside hydrolase family 68 protein [Leuconostoc suionicum]MDC2806426.1 glycoside hydrolase family 68 protein [Leuconostoc suionicum]MDC2823938.1 glycoside hydrolase family 68 protein [Leuconostoc suionicum]
MRKKLYKAGKLWVSGATVAVAVVVAPNIVNADTTNSTDTVNAITTTTSSTTDANNSSTESDTSNADTAIATSKITTNSDNDSKSVTTSNSDSEVNSNSNTQKDEAIKAETTNNQDTKSTTTVAEKTEDSTQADVTNSTSSQEQSTSSVEKLDDSVSKNLNSKTTVVTKNADGTSTTNMTYANLKDVADNIANLNSDTSVPYFNADAIKNLPAMTTADAQTGQIQDLDVWDSWALQDAKTGAVANYHGYNIVFALAGYPKEDNDQHIYMLYTNYGDTALNNWKNAGPVFGFNAKWNEQQWSGSATVNDDDSIQLFYTKTDQPNTIQRLSTANLSMTYTDTEVYVAKVNDDHVLFAGDGEYYQTLQQWLDAGYYTTGDNFTMRDPHVIEVDGERYLAFEANTGTQNYQSDTAVENMDYYGGTDEFNAQAKTDTLNNPDKLKLSKKANGAIGLVRLTKDQNNPTVAQVYSPLLAANGITDEIERANIVPLNGKYYLFTDTRLSKSVVPTADFNINVGMMGYVSDSLFGPYTPLNGSGSVITGTQLFTSRTDTYSYYAVPVEGHSDLLLVTSYMSNRNEKAGTGMNSTFAPSFLIQISADGMSTKVLDTVLAQGTWTYDGKSGSVEELVGNKATSELTDMKIGWVDDKFYVDNELANGYVYDYTNTSYYLFKNGVRLSGVQSYANSYYYFDPVTFKRVDNEIHQDNAGKKYYFGNDGRVKQGQFAVNGVAYNFGNDKTYYERGYASGYLQDVTDNNQWYWFENGQKYTGFRYYMGTYYFFETGTRQESKWETAWGMKYYVGTDGRAVQGIQIIGGQAYDFGTNGTFNLKGTASGYLYSPSLSTANGGYNWFENGKPYTGFRYYMGTYYWFVNGVRQNAGWREAWGMKYYTDASGRALQGIQIIDGQAYDFGTNGTYNLKSTASGYLYSPSYSKANGGYNWFEDGKPYTGFRYYMGTYYWFVNGVRQNAGWREAWGKKYYTDANGRALQGIQKIDGQQYNFGNDGTYYLR